MTILLEKNKDFSVESLVLLKNQLAEGCSCADPASLSVLGAWLSVLRSRASWLRADSDLAVAALDLVFMFCVAHIQRGTQAAAVREMSFAIRIAKRHGLLPQLRRAFNVRSAMLLAEGEALRALKSALRAVRLGRRLQQADVTVNAYLNATLALTHLGLCREAIRLALRIERAYCAAYSAADDVARLLGNAANASLLLGDYDSASTLAGRAVDGMQINDVESVTHAVVFEVTRLRAAIAQRKSIDARQSLGAINMLSRRGDTLRIRLWCRFARAIYADFAHGARDFAREELTAIVAQSKGVRDLALDAAYEFSRLLSTRVPPSTIVRLRKSQAVRARARVLDAGPSVDALDRLAVEAELCDDGTGRSAYRVGSLARELFLALGAGRDEALALERAARLHDIGKLALPLALRAKTGDYGREERLAMQAHAESGALMLDRFRAPSLRLASTVARSHHENWDGSGYPHGLCAEAIPLAARIVRVCDMYDALTRVRRYRSAIAHPHAINLLRGYAGSALDPTLVNAFLRVIEALRLRHDVQLNRYLSAGVTMAPVSSAIICSPRVLAYT